MLVRHFLSSYSLFLVSAWLTHRTTFTALLPPLQWWIVKRTAYRLDA
jgi:hypothetical protein